MHNDPEPQTVSEIVSGRSICFDGFPSECDNHERFQRLIHDSGLFHCYHEVKGEYHYVRHDGEDKSGRIDFLLVPTRKLVAMGWKHRSIGVEVKASGVKIGPAVSQAMDYTRATFETDFGLLVPSAVFLYPVNNKPSHDIESVMTCNRIGIVRSRSWHPLDFYMGVSLLTVDAGNIAKIPNLNYPSGRKVGSR